MNESVVAFLSMYERAKERQRVCVCSHVFVRVMLLLALCLFGKRARPKQGSFAKQESGAKTINAIPLISYVRAYACICVRVRTSAMITLVILYIRVFVYAHVHVHMHVCVWVGGCWCMCMFVFVYTHRHTGKYRNIRTRISAAIS